MQMNSVRSVGTGLVMGAVCVGCGGSADSGDAVDQIQQAARQEPELYTPKPNHGAIEQLSALHRDGAKEDVALIRAMLEQPQAVWFNGGTPKEVERNVRREMARARNRGTPVLVAYNLPYRDCSQYSAGGALGVDEYNTWIAGLAAGIGDGEAIVVLEPDGLGIIPWYDPFADRDTWVDNPNYEWCQPEGTDPSDAADRFDMLNYAVDVLKANPGTQVYLDGTHSGWLGAGDAADRLLQAGVLRADGFFLNASNYREQAHLEKYGEWVAKCIWFADPTSGSWGGGHPEFCASQYFPASPDDFSTWALSDQWYADNVESQTWVPYPGDAGLKHFVIDSSRNGVGPWTPPPDAPGDAQDWCNPPDRGLGLRPTTNTGSELIDAYLWIKIPGESDGECNRWVDGGPDPIRGYVNPPAGRWFPEQVLELVHNANPPLE